MEILFIHPHVKHTTGKKTIEFDQQKRILERLLIDHQMNNETPYLAEGTIGTKSEED